MVARKRGREEMESSEPIEEQSMLDKIRSTWELANLMQYVFIFGRAVKIDEDLTIEVGPYDIGSDPSRSILDLCIIIQSIKLTKNSTIGS